MLKHLKLHWIKNKIDFVLFDSDYSNTDIDKTKVFQLEISEKAQNGYQIDKDYDPYKHRKVEHPLT